MKRSTLCIFLVAVAIPSLAMGETSTESDAIDSTRSTLAKWVETRQIVSEEKRDWELGKEVLEQRIALLEGEVAALQEKISVARGGIEEADLEQRERIAQNRGLRQASATLEEVIGAVEAKTRALLVSLPEPLARRVEPLSRKLPEDPAKTELSLGERFQNALGILNEINKFNREIVVTREIRELPGGSTAEVQTIYLGLGQAYYVTPNGDAAGTGRPGPGGWSWSASNEMAQEIARAIAILQNEDVPAYVPLPVQVQ